MLATGLMYRRFINEVETEGTRSGRCPRLVFTSRETPPLWWGSLR
jgi:hypothetical protein